MKKKLIKNKFGFYVDEDGQFYELRDSRFHQINDENKKSPKLVGWGFSRYSEGYVTSKFTSQILYYCGLN